MMASALLGLPCADKICHCFEDLVHASHVFVQEMMVVNLEEPVISFILVQSPMTEFLIWIYCFLSFWPSGLGSF